MTEQEERDLAWRLADSSRVFDFETALKLVKHNPADAEELVRNQEGVERTKEEFARQDERRRQAFIEDFGYEPRRQGS